MSSQRPKKARATSRSSGGSITLPPELAAQYLRNAVNHATSSSSSSSNDDAEMKALMSMFVEIMGMSPEEGGTRSATGVSFSFSSGPASSSSSTTNWPPNAAAAAAAAASGMFTSDGQWSFDYYNEDQQDDDDDDVPDLSLKPSSIPQEEESTIEDDAETNAADAMARQIAQDEVAAEEERAKKAAKRREKKQRKKLKAKQEAALKAQEAQVQKRSKQIQSWKSRVVAACQANEEYKMQALLSESPLGKQQDEDVITHLEFLLPHCIAPSGKNEGDRACQKLATFVISMNVSVAFSIGRNGRSALHTACLVGDFFFVKLATDKSEEDSPLDLLCKDSGWTPLHYAVVAGCQEAMEEMLLVGCDHDTRTDESLTCRSSTGEGLTALELAEIIASGKHDDEIETQGAALEEAMQRYANNKADRKRYLRTMKSVVERLRQVDEHGYNPQVDTDSSKIEDEKVSSSAASSSEDAKKKSKKKKKKQVKREQSEVSTASSVPSNTDAPKVDVPVVEKKVDPLVTALLGMGFTAEQIYAAAKACGGMERATADEMVMWILGGGEEAPSSPAATRAESNDTASPVEATFVTKNNRQPKQAPAPKKSAQKKNAANLKRAQKENVEAVMREEEARAIANRIAAKREEQRRRNREWNNRAQARQKEEMEQRAQEEAKRIANERAVAQRQAAAAPILASKAKAAQARAASAQAPAPTQILQRPSHMPVGGLQAGMPAQQSYPGGIPANAAEANMMGYPSQGYGDYNGMAQYVSSGNSVSSAGSGRNTAAAAQYVSSGNSVSSAGSGMNAVAAQYVSSGNSVSSHGSGMQYHQAHQPMYGYPVQSVPPPGFHPFGGTPATSASSLTVNEETPVNYDESGSGEIRATARSFVPTAFKPAEPTSSSSSTAASTSAPVPPPGMSLPTTTAQKVPTASNDGVDPLAALLSAAAPGAVPSGLETSPALASASTVEEPSLNSALGFDLNGTTGGSSLLGSLSLPPTGATEPTGSGIWGGSSTIAPGSLSLAGFGAPGTDAASKTGDAAVGDGGNGMWTSDGLNQRGTSRLGSIW